MQTVLKVFVRLSARPCHASPDAINSISANAQRSFDCFIVVGLIVRVGIIGFFTVCF